MSKGGDGGLRSARAKTGFLDAALGDTFSKLHHKSGTLVSAGVKAKQDAANEMAKEFNESYVSTVGEKPFMGAQPKILRQPEVIGLEESEKRTTVVIRALRDKIMSASRVLLALGEDCKDSQALKEVLEHSVEEPIGDTPGTVVSLAESWMHTIPYVSKVGAPWRDSLGKSLFIYIGTPGRYLMMCTRSTLKDEFDDAYANNRLVVICRGGCILPVGTQVENVYGIDAKAVISGIAGLVSEKGKVHWGFAAGSKAKLLELAFAPTFSQNTEKASSEVEPAKYEESADKIMFDYFVDYIKHFNEVKLANPTIPMTNFYDTGMLVSVVMGSIVERGVSLLTDHDGLVMLRDASIGHTMSKLNQLVMVEPQNRTRSVYNFFIGDGACRLNGGIELAMHLIQDYRAAPFINLFVFNNGVWAIEDNLVAHAEEQHILRNFDFYDLMDAHSNVCICENAQEFSVTLEFLTKQMHEYLDWKAKPELRIVVVRGLDINVPPLLGNLEPIMKSSDMAFLRHTLGKFAEGSKQKVPIYGCSAFEYIQFLDIFMSKMPEGKNYQYVCGRTDIQAAHMCGYRQADSKCVLMINDVYGINSLGEALRALTTGFQVNQLLIMIWHPTLVKVMDHFHLHRQPMVWPSLGPHLCKYYVRSESDIFTYEFQGEPTDEVAAAIERKTPLIVVNMLPEHERNFITLDVRMKVDLTRSDGVE